MNTIYNPGNRSIVEGNTFHNCTHGVGVWYTGTQIQNVIIRRNRFHDMGRFDIDTWMQGANSSMAIHVSVPGGGHQIYNNIIYNSGSQAFFTGITVGTQADSATTVLFANNTIYNLLNASAYAVTTPFTSTQITNNIVYLSGAGINGGTQSHNLLTNPSFVDAAAADFRPQSGSAIDQGVTVAVFTVDYAGVPRPQGAAYDIGAYESNGASNPPPAAPMGVTVR
jgi:hypothetical protein